MLYQRSLKIERRLEAVQGMIRKGNFSTHSSAETLGVYIPTVSRDVTALRQRGQIIRSARGDDGWRYVLASDGNDRRKRRAPSSTKAPTSREAG